MARFFLVLVGMAFLCGCGEETISPDAPRQDSGRRESNLPVTDPRWRQLVLDRGWMNSNDTWTLELEHGWLVWRRFDGTGSLTFVPKPEKKDVRP